jgi:D-tyrosyl-tRNA(Tyr) deacylase
MRTVIQRVTGASITVGGVEVASIGRGLLVYLGVQRGDDETDLVAMAEKVAHLRIFEDREGAMNLSLLDTGGEVLVVSQFTLLGDCRRGRRPSFSEAMEPAGAEPIYERFVEELGRRGATVKKGRFRAMMQVTSINDGPVTILVDSRKNF